METRKTFLLQDLSFSDWISKIISQFKVLTVDPLRIQLNENGCTI